MTKRLVSLALAVLMLTAVALPAAVAGDEDYIDPRAGYYYVKTENGKGLNVRNHPGGGQVVGSLKYGTRIYVDTFTTPEWALITYKYDNGYGVGEYVAWVSTRYLTRKNPGKFVPSATAAPASKTAGTPVTLDAVNAIFRTAKKVDAPYTVVARPSRASGWVNLVVIIVVAIIMTVLVTFVELGERRIPLQIAKQTKGRRVYGGQNTRLTLKVVSVGVMPLIFAYSFLAFPSTIIQLVDPQANGGFTQWWLRNMSNGSWLYLLLSALLIIGFTYFYSSISFDPQKQADQLIMQGATIPGQRGRNMKNYLQTIVGRLNLFAALYLAVLSAVPSLITRGLNASVPFAASSILIAVSVALESIRTIQGEMSVRGIEMDVEKGGFM